MSAVYKEERDMRHKNNVLLLVTFLLIMSLPMTAISGPKVTLKPKISTTYRIDDNFWKAETVEREVLTGLIQPGFVLGYGTEKTSISVDYTMDIYHYNDRDDLQPGWQPANYEDFVGHTGIVDIKTKPSDRVTLGVSNAYNLTRDPAQADRFSNAVTRNKYYIDRLTPMLFYNFGAKFGAGLKYRYTRTNYSEDLSEGSTENRAIFDLVYNLNKSASLDFEYQYWSRDYSTSSDYTSNQIKAILRKQYKYFSLEAGAGYHDRDFDKPTLEDVSMTTWNVGLTGQYPSTAVTPTSYLSLSAENNFNDSGTGDQYYEAMRFTLDAGHVFNKKFPLGIKAIYQNSDYKTVRGLTPAGIMALRDEDTKGIEGSLGYIINDYLVFKVIAGNEKRDSNIAGRNYTNNYLMGRLDFITSLGRR
jgi:hypothetical protein